MAALASRAEDKDTIDLAVIGGVKDGQALKGYQVTHFQPFDPVHKRTEATVKGTNGKEFKVTKGAPQVILELSANAGQESLSWRRLLTNLRHAGFRSLGVARADQKGKWQFIGVLPLFDPPREEAKTTIATARQMGVNVKMVTGDAIAIAKETAIKLGLGTNILDASGFGDKKVHETAQLAESIEKADGFAQVFPEHKFHIVDVLQQRGHIVGMTGDGVNDAPALKKADCGIAVSGATDAARVAASIVLLAPGLSVIIDAIKESRKIFQRMNSYAIYRIAETLRAPFFMTHRVRANYPPRPAHRGDPPASQIYCSNGSIEKWNVHRPQRTPVRPVGRDCEQCQAPDSRPRSPLLQLFCPRGAQASASEQVRSGYSWLSVSCVAIAYGPHQFDRCKLRS